MSTCPSASQGNASAWPPARSGMKHSSQPPQGLFRTTGSDFTARLQVGSREPRLHPGFGYHPVMSCPWRLGVGPRHGWPAVPCASTGRRISGLTAVSAQRLTTSLRSGLQAASQEWHVCKHSIDNLLAGTRTLCLGFVEERRSPPTPAGESSGSRDLRNSSCALAALPATVMRPAQDRATLEPPLRPVAYAMRQGPRWQARRHRLPHPGQTWSSPQARYAATVCTLAFSTIIVPHLK